MNLLQHLPQNSIDALEAAADFDLYRVCGTRPAEFVRGAGGWVDPSAVVWAIARGLLGVLAKPQLLPTGVYGQRLDFSDYGLEWYVAVSAPNATEAATGGPK